MPFPTIADPVPGTVITAAWEIANPLAAVRWLRLMTGNADPPGSQYVVVSTSSTAAAWSKVPTDAIADLAVTAAKLAAGAAVSNIGYQPMDPRGQVMSGALQVQTQLIVAATGAADGTIAIFERGGAIQWALSPTGGVFRITKSPLGDGLELDYPADQVRWRGNRIWTANSSPVYAGALTTPIVNCTVADGATPPLSVHVNQANIAVPNLKAQRATNADAATTATSATSAANATRVGGFLPSGTPAPNVVPVADAAGKLDAWVSPAVAGAYVPTGAIVAFDTLAHLTAAGSGWQRHTPANGRLLVGEDGVTFTAGSSYGSTWAHTHTDNGHIHGAAALSVGGTLGGPDSVNGLATAGGVNLPTTTHKHDTSGLDVAGSTDNAAASIANTTWLPPMLAVVWGLKL